MSWALVVPCGLSGVDARFHSMLLSLPDDASMIRRTAVAAEGEVYVTGKLRTISVMRASRRYGQER